MVAVSEAGVEERSHDGAVEERLVRAVDDTDEAPPLRDHALRARERLEDDFEVEGGGHDEEVHTLGSLLEELLGALCPHRCEVLEEEDREDAHAALCAQMLALMVHVRHVRVGLCNGFASCLEREVVLVHDGKLQLDACHDKGDIGKNKGGLGGVSLSAVEEMINVVLGFRDHGRSRSRRRLFYGLVLLRSTRLGLAGGCRRRRGVSSSGRRRRRRRGFLGRSRLFSSGSLRLSMDGMQDEDEARGQSCASQDEGGG
mmetsp:Transcript_502/g.1053  ORF Transcript_502/g.1053 Transcript_502/m.1053 type:complete len:257 (-) Transcript_502:18-788(-)